VKIDLPENLGRLPKAIELGLFRVLQESLTNIHRHSGSPRAEVSLKVLPEKVLLEVRDFGKGIPPRLLESFQTKGISFGVGLAGMRERVRELGGRLEIQAQSPGSLVSASLPLTENVRAKDAAAD
jgi:signal transduction histidine kinase